LVGVRAVCDGGAVLVEVHPQEVEVR